MSTESLLRVRDLDIQVVRKTIKNLHVAVYPPYGHVRVAAPAHMDDEAIRLAVVDRLAWIHRRRRELLSQPRQSEREMITGETHYLWGRRYRLEVVESADERPSVSTARRSTLRLTVRPGADREQRAEALSTWYRQELRREAEGRIEKWAAVVDVHVDDWRIRRMRTKWGSCNVDAARVWLNLELAKKAPQCLDYVIVHELVHLRERKHSVRFEQLMDRALPTWRTQREELYRLPLGHEEWPDRGVTIQ
jgi:predicted metal-dependent hydrolase